MFFKDFKNRVSGFWNPQPSETVKIPESVKKEDSFIVPRYIETRVSTSKPQEHSSHTTLQMGFCCTKPNTKLLVSNHATQLFDCNTEKCPRKLIKTKIGGWN